MLLSLYKVSVSTGPNWWAIIAQENGKKSTTQRKFLIVLDLIVTDHLQTILVAGLVRFEFHGQFCQYIELLFLGAAKSVIGFYPSD